MLLNPASPLALALLLCGSQSFWIVCLTQRQQPVHIKREAMDYGPAVRASLGETKFTQTATAKSGWLRRLFGSNWSPTIAESRSAEQP